MPDRNDILESIYYGELYCECGWRAELPEDVEVEEAGETWNEHVREEHPEVVPDA